MTTETHRKIEETSESGRIENEITADQFLSLLASYTSRPGPAKPPLTLPKGAWNKMVENPWIVSLITGFATLFSGFVLGQGGPSIWIVALVALGVGLLVGGLLLGLFFLFTLVYVKVLPP